MENIVQQHKMVHNGTEGGTQSKNKKNKINKYKRGMWILK